MQSVYFYDSVIGFYALQETDGALTQMWLGNRISLVPQDVKIEETSLIKKAKEQLDSYFAGELKVFSVPLLPKGTAFQLKVWKMLSAIPYGEYITYGELARRVGDPKASRAVGTANGHNPLPIFIPCHRVVGAGGKLTGYTGGIHIKEKLLVIENISLFR